LSNFKRKSFEKERMSYPIDVFQSANLYNVNSPKGYYVNQYYNDWTGEVSYFSSPCSDGTFSDVVNALWCANCPPGYTSNSSKTGCIACSPGQYSTGGTICMTCPDGSYSSNAGSSSCTPVASNQITNSTKTAIGGTCTGGTVPNGDKTACVPCPAGTIAVGNSYYVAPGPGLYAPYPGMTAGISIPDGKYSPDNINIYNCPPGTYPTPDRKWYQYPSPGYYANGTSQIQCSVGTYSPGNSPISACTQVDRTKGEYVSTTGATAPSRSPPGYTVNLGGTGIDQCPIGSYSKDGIVCVKADGTKGEYVSTVGASKVSMSPPGSQPNFIGLGATGIVSCSPGSYSKDGMVCVKADGTKGEYVPGTGAIAPLLSPPGSQPNILGIGATGTSVCLPGTYSPDGKKCLTVLNGYTVTTDVSGARTGVKQCMPIDYPYEDSITDNVCIPKNVGCGTGQYYDMDKKVCLPIPAGYAFDSTKGLRSKSNLVKCTSGYSPLGSDICLPIPPGNKVVFDSSGLRIGIQKCSAGTYSKGGVDICTPCIRSNREISAEGSSSPSYCTSGTQPNSDLSACDTCPSGTYSVDGSVCVPSDMGFYVKDSDKTMQVKCPVNTYTDTRQNSSCKSCPVGQISQDGKTCVPIGKSQVVDLSSPTLVKNCTGYTIPNETKTECVLCPSGMYTNDNETCLNSGPGYYVSENKRLMCGAGKYADGETNSECKMCGLNQVTNKDHTVCIDCETDLVPDESGLKCVCPPGTQLIDGRCVKTLTPKDCPPGNRLNISNMTCESCLAQGMIVSADGYSCEMCGNKERTVDGVNCLPYITESDCSYGEIMNSTRTACEFCGKNKFTLDHITCRNCPEGTIVNDTHTGCTVCPPGLYTDDNVECKMCPDGYIPNSTRSACDKIKSSAKATTNTIQTENTNISEPVTEKKGLSTGAKIGIGIGVTVGVGLLIKLYLAKAATASLIV
jgi:hypothetical protein